MKITMLTTSFPLLPHSSSGIFVARLVDKLAEMAEVTVVTPAYTNISHPLKRGEIAIIPCRYAPARWQQLAQAPGGMPVATQNHPWLWLLLPGLLISLGWHCLRAGRSSDLIHANWAICGCIGGIAGMLAGKPVITTLRGDDVTRAEKYRVDFLLLRLCFIFNRKIICVSEDMLGWLRERFPQYTHKLVMIGNGVDDGFIKAGVNRRNNDDGMVRLITVGSLIARKGINLIIKAWSRIGAPAEAQLVIVGDGPEKKKLKDMAEAQRVVNRIRFAGAVAPEDVVAHLRQADIFILASHSEGRPNVLLEAMAVGLAVIASDIRGVRELIEHEHTGLLFEADEMDQLAECMRRLITDPVLRARLGSAGREWVLDRKLTWKNSADRYVQLYQQVIR